MTTKNSALIHDFYATYNAHDIKKTMHFFSDGATLADLALPDTLVGREQIRGRLLEFFSAFPDVVMTLKNVISTRDWVVCEWKAQGTHRSIWAGIPATFSKVAFTGVSLFQISNHQIKHNHIYWDVYRLFKQIGVIEFPTVFRRVA